MSNRKLARFNNSTRTPRYNKVCDRPGDSSGHIEHGYVKQTALSDDFRRLDPKTSDTKEPLGYTKHTALSDDFRRLIPDAELKPAYKSTRQHCFLCLEIDVTLKALPCRHTFCSECLQTSIDSAPPDPDSDRGFLCKLCGYFVKVKDPTVPRTEWAAQISPARKQHGSEELGLDKDFNAPGQKWHLEWKISTYPKSFFIENQLDPSKRTEGGFDVSKRVMRNNSGASNGTRTPTPEAAPSRDSSLPEHRRGRREAAVGLNIDVSDLSAKPTSARTLPLPKASKITSATFHGEVIIVYDQGLQEIILYNSDLTIRSSFSQRGVHSISVLDDILFMTIPQNRCIETLKILKTSARGTIYITKKCYSLCRFEDRLAVLLSDHDDERFHVGFLDGAGITGGHISVGGGHVQFKRPSHIAVCPLTRLLYVGDKQMGLVKCFLMDGQLIWEKTIYDAGCMCTYNGYLLLSREYTNTIDVLSGKGVHTGKLESSEYSIVSPSVIALQDESANILIVDETQMMHVFAMERLDMQDTSTKNTADGTFCSCSIS